MKVILRGWTLIKDKYAGTNNDWDWNPRQVVLEKT
jgi:hypothetical protein